MQYKMRNKGRGHIFLTFVTPLKKE